MKYTKLLCQNLCQFRTKSWFARWKIKFFLESGISGFLAALKPREVPFQTSCRNLKPKNEKIVGSHFVPIWAICSVKQVIETEKEQMFGEFCLKKGFFSRLENIIGAIFLKTALFIMVSTPNDFLTSGLIALAAEKEESESRRMKTAQDSKF